MSISTFKYLFLIGLFAEEVIRAPHRRRQRREWREKRADLGRNWSPTLQITEAHTLVMRGVYQHIRHPIYAVVWLTGIAQALMLANWIAGPACLVLFLPLYLVRVPREERMMLDHFGDEYRAYMSRTGGVIPRVGR